MRRLRVVAGGVAVLTALIDWMLALDPSVVGAVTALVALSAACLAAFTPFEALEPPGRRLAFLACLSFLIGVAVAATLATRTGAGTAPVASLCALAGGGAVLTVWSFAIRNRRRRSGWRNYYDR